MKKTFLSSIALVLMVSGFCPVMAMPPDESDETIVNVADENAQFPGGDEACMKWLRNHVKYPGICQEQGIQGRVVVSFVVNKDGSVVEAEVMRSPDQHLSDEALRVVNAMPKWKPARLGNKVVRSRYNLPIMFRLTDGNLGTVQVSALEEAGINPRGIFRLMWLDGKKGAVTSPWDQYKICTDDATLTLLVQGKSSFSVQRQDDVFNYTGEKKNPSGAFAPRIYDSNESGFTLKWWSEFENNSYFPYLDWCKEYYSADIYSSSAKPLFDMLCASNEQNKQNPLIGIWHRGKSYSDLKAAKAEAKVLLKDGDAVAALMKQSSVTIFGSDLMIRLVGFKTFRGFVDNVEYDGRKSFTYGPEIVSSVTWISDNCVVIGSERMDKKEYNVYIRHTEKTDALSFIRSYLLSR